MWGMVRKEHRRTLLNSTAVQVLNSITGFEPSGASSSPSAADGPHSFWPQPHEWVRDLAREKGTAKSETMYLCTVLYCMYCMRLVPFLSVVVAAVTVVLSCTVSVVWTVSDFGGRVRVMRCKYLCRIERLSVAGCRLGGGCCFSG